MIVVKEDRKFVGGNIPGFHHFDIAERRVAVDMGFYDLVCKEKARGLTAYFPGAPGGADDSVQQFAEIPDTQIFSCAFDYF